MKNKIIITLIGLLLTGSLVWVIGSKHNKNKELLQKLERCQSPVIDMTISRTVDTVIINNAQEIADSLIDIINKQHSRITRKEKLNEELLKKFNTINSIDHSNPVIDSLLSKWGNTKFQY